MMSAAWEDTDSEDGHEDGNESIRRYRQREEKSQPTGTSRHSQRHYYRRKHHSGGSSSGSDQTKTRIPLDAATRPAPLPRTSHTSFGNSCDQGEIHLGDTAAVSYTTDPSKENSHQNHVLEASLQRLQDLNNGIQHLCKLNKQSSYNSTHSQRSGGNIKRHSSSCPSLLDHEGLKLHSTAPQHIDSNVLNVLRQISTSYIPMDTNEPVMSTHRSHVEPDVRICINDITVDSDEFSTQDEDEMSKEFIKAQKRRSSWCPEEGRKKEEKREKKQMLAVSGRSQSLSSLEGDDSDDDEEDEGDVYAASQDVHHYKAAVSRGHRMSLGGATPVPPPRLLQQYRQARNSTRENRNPGSSSPTQVLSLQVSPSDSGSGQPKSLSASNSPATTPPTPYNKGVRSLSDVHSPADTLTPGHYGPTFMNSEDKSSNNVLMKSISSPAFHQQQDRHGRHEVDGTHQTPSILRQPYDDDDDEWFKQPTTTPRNRMSMIDFLNNPRNFESDEASVKGKDEKKTRRSSVLSKFGSYRQKRLMVKESKNKSTHTFVHVSFSNSAVCDVCFKSMYNKPALQCENCDTKVHETSCREQIISCAKAKQFRMTGSDSKEQVSTQQYTTGVKSSNSFRDWTRSSAGSGKQVQQSSKPNSSSKALNDNGASPEISASVSPNTQPTLLELGIHEKDNISVSMESLDEGEVDFDEDPQLYLEPEPAEAWSVTVDKKTLKKMNNKDIKRQDHIWELIQTERSHCRTLKIMQKVFSKGMLQELHMSQEMIDRIFPKLNDLIDIHLTFLQRLIDRQRQSFDLSIDEIGDILKLQFEGEMGHRMKVAYGEFCSRHNEAVQLYKDILKSDRKFQNFIKKCNQNEHTKRKGIPECILLVTQRVTKYPLLIEPIIKTTKESKRDHHVVVQSLYLCRLIISFVNSQIDARLKEQRLIEIFNKLDARSFAMYRNKKFKKSDLLSSNRKLLHDGTIKWMSARGRSFEVLAVILSDLMFFLLESNQKYTFFTQDNKSSVVSLSKLLVREKSDTRDSKGIYLICQSKTEPEMYELVCKSTEERIKWIKTIRDATASCPEEVDEPEDAAPTERIDEGLPSETEEDRKLLEAKEAKLRQYIDLLHQKDLQIRRNCDDKLKTCFDILELFGVDDATSNIQAIYKEEGTELIDLQELLQNSLRDISTLTSMLQSNTPLLNRSVSSVGERSTDQSDIMVLPKRAETFAGFEGRVKVRGSRTSETDSPDEDLVLDPPDEGSRRDQDNKHHHSDSTDSLLSADQNKMGRRMSTSFLQNLLNRQHNDKSEEGSGKLHSEQNSAHSSDLGSSSELAVFVTSQRQMPFQASIIPSQQEQVTLLTNLMQHINALVCVATQQNTEVESIRGQLAATNDRVTKLYAELERCNHDRKNTFQHDKQLEELRNVQRNVAQEKQQVKQLREQQEEAMRLEQDNLVVDRKKLELEKVELQSKFDELKREKDALQRQIDLFEEQKVQLQRQEQSRSTNEWRGSPSGSRRSRSPGSSAHLVPPGSVPQTVWDKVAHKRSASDDAQTGLRSDLHNPGHKVRPSQSFKETADKQLSSAPSVPVHLISATNEQKIVSKGAQHLPMRLSSTSSSSLHSQPIPSSSPPYNNTSSSTSTSSLAHQVLPYKLSSSLSSNLANSGASGHHGSTGHHGVIGHHKSGSSSPLTPPTQQKLSMYRNDSRSSISSEQLTGSRNKSQSHLGSRKLPHQMESIGLPLKLAEKSSKSGSPSAMSRFSHLKGASTDESPPQSNNVDRKDQEIIYF